MPTPQSDAGCARIARARRRGHLAQSARPVARGAVRCAGARGSKLAVRAGGETYLGAPSIGHGPEEKRFFCNGTSFQRATRAWTQLRTLCRRDVGLSKDVLEARARGTPALLASGCRACDEKHVGFVGVRSSRRRLESMAQRRVAYDRAVHGAQGAARGVVRASREAAEREAAD